MIDVRSEPRENEELQTLIAATWNGELGPCQRNRLDELLLADDEAMEFYLTCMAMHGRLLWQYRGATDQVKQWAADHGASEGLADDSDRDARIPAIVPVPYADPSHSLLGSMLQGGWMLSYLTATVILGAMLLSAWAYKISHSEQIVQPSTPGVIEGERMEYVARITGMKECRSADGESPIYLGSAATLGRKYSLVSGLLEITYRNGARVILEGPCTYKVDSRSGGYLSLGKLTARVDNAKPQAVNPDPRNSSLIPHPSSFFSVTTPTAVVTDLGTEFGVEVSENGDTTSHVFRGSVKVKAIGGDGNQETVLRENESVRVELAGNQISMMRRITVSPEGFTRQMPEPPPVVFLRDTFETQSESNAYGMAGGYGLNKCLESRQAGTCRPIHYIRGGDYAANISLAQAGHASCSGKLNLLVGHGQAGWVVLNRNFPSNVEVAAELAPDVLHHAISKSLAPSKRILPGDPNSDNWLALGIRGQSLWLDHRELSLASDAGAVLLMRANGKWGYFENGKLICEGRVSPVHPYHVVMRMVGDRLDIQVNGIAIDLDSDGPGTARAIQGLLAETKNNFITLGACKTDTSASPGWLILNSVDNLTISSVRPNTRTPIRKERSR